MKPYSRKLLTKSIFEAEMKLIKKGIQEDCYNYFS